MLKKIRLFAIIVLFVTYVVATGLFAGGIAYENGQYLTPAQVAAFSNETMSVLYETKWPAPAKDQYVFAQGDAYSCVKACAEFHKEYASSEAGSNIVFTMVPEDPAQASIPGNPGLITIAITNATSTLEWLMLLDERAETNITFVYTNNRVVWQ